MEKETIFGEVIGKANHYKAVPDNNGGRRIIKDDVIRRYEQSFISQCLLYKDRRINQHFRLIVDVWFMGVRSDIDNSIKTILDCLQYCNAITDDNLCYHIDATKHICRNNPRIVYAIDIINEQKQLFNE